MNYYLCIPSYFSSNDYEPSHKIPNTKYQFVITNLFVSEIFLNQKDLNFI